MEFENKVALVTGATGSIGKGIAQRFCEQGAKVFITDLDQTKIDQCCTEIDTSGKLCKGLAADVTDHQQVVKVVQAALSEFGAGIDILVNVAGIVAQGKVEDIDEKSWNVSASDIERKITSRTKAIMAVHLLGMPADMPAIMALAKKHDLKVIEDCAQAPGASIDGQLCGSFGDLSSSFLPDCAPSPGFSDWCPCDC